MDGAAADGCQIARRTRKFPEFLIERSCTVLGVSRAEVLGFLEIGDNDYGAVTPNAQAGLIFVQERDLPVADAAKCCLYNGGEDSQVAHNACGDVVGPLRSARAIHRFEPFKRESTDDDYYNIILIALLQANR